MLRQFPELAGIYGLKIFRDRRHPARALIEPEASRKAPLAPWLIYFKERFPLATYVLLVGGFSVSGNFVGGGPFNGVGVLASFLGLLIFFAGPKDDGRIKRL